MNTAYIKPRNKKLQPAGRKYPDKNKNPINHTGFVSPVCNELETLYQLLS
jgi:hypothetical protein